MTIITKLTAILSALSSLPQMAADIAAIKAAQQQASEGAVLPVVNDIKAIVINIQAEIGQE